MFWYKSASDRKTYIIFVSIEFDQIKTLSRLGKVKFDRYKIKILLGSEVIVVVVVVVVVADIIVGTKVDFVF